MLDVVARDVSHGHGSESGGEPQLDIALVSCDGACAQPWALVPEIIGDEIIEGDAAVGTPSVVLFDHQETRFFSLCFFLGLEYVLSSIPRAIEATTDGDIGYPLAVAQFSYGHGKIYLPSDLVGWLLLWDPAASAKI